MWFTNNTCCGILLNIVGTLTIMPLSGIVYGLLYLFYGIYQIFACGYPCCNKNKFLHDPTSPRPRHHITGMGGVRFKNPWASGAYGWPPSLKDLYLFFWDIKSQYSVDRDGNKDGPLIPVDKVNYQQIKEFDGNSNKIQFTWIGHATCLIQFNGFNILTDAMFSLRCSPHQWWGHKRYVSIDKDIWKSNNLPIIDALIISHDHYDHLDYNSLKYLFKNNKIRYYCAPLRVGQWLNKNIKVPYQQIIELDWWKSATIEPRIDHHDYELGINIDSTVQKLHQNGIKLRVICTPCQHFSGRGAFDNGYRLWASWVIQSIVVDDDKCKILNNVFFAGDTGYRDVMPRSFLKKRKCCDWLVMKGSINWDITNNQIIEKENELSVICPVFKQIGDKYGPFDLSLLPIGSYSPRWLMCCVHLNPYDALLVHNDIKSKKSIGIHWGAFLICDERLSDPQIALNKLKKQFGQSLNINNDDFITTIQGQTVIFD